MTRRDPEADEDAGTRSGDVGPEGQDGTGGAPGGQDEPAVSQSGDDEAIRERASLPDSEPPNLHAVVNWAPETRVNQAFSHAASSGLKIILALVAVAVLYIEFESALRAGVTQPRFVFFVSLSAVPALALVLYIWSTDVSASTSPLVLVGIFLLGGLYVGLAGRLQVMVQPYVTAEFINPISLSDAGSAVVLFLLVGAPIEELLKLLVVRLYAFESGHFRSVLSGAVYGAVAGLGFATMENAVFIVDSVGSTSASRRAIAGPGHVIYSAIAGLYLGLARFNRQYAGPIVLKGLTVAVGFHALYNTIISPETVDLPARIAALLDFSEIAGLVTVVIVYDGLVFLFLFHQLSKYRNAREAASELPESELTEFDS